MNKPFFLALSFLYSASIFAANEPADFEGPFKLVNTQSFPEEGLSEIVESDTEKRMEMRRSRRWVDKLNGNGSARLRVFDKSVKNAELYRQQLFEFQQYTCPKFEEFESHESANSIVLTTRCEMAYGHTITTIQKLIESGTALYVFERIFNQDVVPSQLEAWTTYVSRLSLCNTDDPFCRQSRGF